MKTNVKDNSKCGYGDVFYNGKLKIITWDDDTNKEPNFQIIDTETSGKNVDCRISMIFPKYISFDKPLSKRIINSMIKHLKSNNKHVMNISKWKLLIMSWNLNNERKISGKRIPDYTKLKG